MAISNNMLWKLLVDKKMSKADLRKAAGIAPKMLQKTRAELKALKAEVAALKQA